MNDRLSKRLMTGGAAAAFAVAALACDGATQPLLDAALLDGSPTSGDESMSTPLPADAVETLFSGSQSGIDDERRQVVEDDGVWATVWSELHAFVSSEPARPAVDFATQRVVLVTTGTRSTGGHRLELVEAVSDGTAVAVEVRHVAPGPGCLTTQQITRPALAISVPRSAGDPLVTVDLVYDDCS